MPLIGLVKRLDNFMNYQQIQTLLQRVKALQYECRKNKDINGFIKYTSIALRLMRYTCKSIH